MVSTAVFLCGLWGGGRLAPVLLALLIFLPAISGLWFYFSVKGLSFSVTGERSCRCGQQIGIKLKLVYPFFHSAGNIQVHVVCENHVFGVKKEEFYMLEPGKGKENEYTLFLDTVLCGERVVRIQELLCYDLLGLFSRRKSMEGEFVCTVYPYDVQLYVSLQKNREREQPGDIYDGKKSGSDVSEVFGLREYREGDPLQSIHWKLSGKMNQLIVREFGRPVNYHTLVLLSPAFSYGDKDVPEETANAVFDLGLSLSQALLNQSLAHFVGYLSGGELCCIPVDSLHSYEEMLFHLMGYPIQKDGDDTLISFLDQQLYRQYTKVVYVTGAVNEVAARNLSVLVDLTVLQAVRGDSGYLSGSAGYTVVGVSIETLRNIEHIIPL